MKKNIKLKIGIMFFLTLNIILVISGLILINKRMDSLVLSVYNTFHSKSFVYYLTDGQTNDFDEMKTNFNPNYEFDESVGDENYKKIISDSGYKYRNHVRENFITNTVTWEQFIDILEIFAIPSDSNINTDLFENGIVIAMFIYLDSGKGTMEFDENLDIVENFLNYFSVSYNQDNVINFINFFNTTFPNGLENGISIPLIGDIKINLFSYSEEFNYTEQLLLEQKDVYYNFENGLNAGDYNGIPGERLGIKNWKKDEIVLYVEDFGLNVNFLDNNSFIFNWDLWKVLNDDSNTYYLFLKYIKKSYKKYFLNLEQPIEYDKYKIKNSVLPSDSDWWVEIDNSNSIIQFSSIRKIDSIGETFLYSIYDNINYKKYFLKALEIDGLNQYDLFNILNFYMDYNYNYVDYKFESNSAINPVLFSEEKTKITFSEFFFICKYYSPFMREELIDDFILDLSKEITKGINFSDLEKPNNV